MKVVAAVEVAIVVVVDGAQVQVGRSFFLSLSLPRLEEPRLAMNSLYNVYKLINAYNKHNMDITLNVKN